jgi:hypothetical protein
MLHDNLCVRFHVSRKHRVGHAMYIGTDVHEDSGSITALIRGEEAGACTSGHLYIAAGAGISHLYRCDNVRQLV